MSFAVVVHEIIRGASDLLWTPLAAAGAQSSLGFRVRAIATLVCLTYVRCTSHCKVALELLLLSCGQAGSVASWVLFRQRVLGDSWVFPKIGVPLLYPK